MNQRMYKATVLLLVAALLVVAVAWRLQRRSSAAVAPGGRLAGRCGCVAAAAPVIGGRRPLPSAEAPKVATTSVPAVADETASSASSFKPTPEYPAVIDLGMGKCIPCKQMKPILDELKQEYAGRCRIEIIDIGKHPDQSDKYGIMLIPTQIFFGKGGREVYRHEGFMPKADIVAKLGEMGVR